MEGVKNFSIFLSVIELSVDDDTNNTAQSEQEEVLNDDDDDDDNILPGSELGSETGAKV